MSTYPILNIEPELFRTKTKDDEIKDVRYRTEKHDHENLLKSLKYDNECDKKKYKSLHKKKVLMIASEILIGSVGLGVGSGLTISGLAPVGIMCANSITFFSSISTLTTDEFFSKLKMEYTKLSDSINVITLFFENTFKQSMVDEKIDGKEAHELNKSYDHYLVKRKVIMENTQFKVEKKLVI